MRPRRSTWAGGRCGHTDCAGVRVPGAAGGGVHVRPAADHADLPDSGPSSGQFFAGLLRPYPCTGCASVTLAQGMTTSITSTQATS